MVKILLGTLLANFATAILTVALLFVLLTGIESGFHIHIPSGTHAIAADPKASDIKAITVLVCTLLAAAISGFVSLPFIGLRPAASGPLSCALVVGFVLLNLLIGSQPTHDGIPKILKVAGYVSAFPIAALGAHVRSRIKDQSQGWIVALPAAILSYVCVLIVGVVALLVLQGATGPGGIFAVFGATVFFAAYAGIMIGTRISSQDQRPSVMGVLVALAILAPLSYCVFSGVSGRLSALDFIPLLGSVLAGAAAFRMTRKYGWIQTMADKGVS